jgi:hypothetical protein
MIPHINGVISYSPAKCSFLITGAFCTGVVPSKENEKWLALI